MATRSDDVGTNRSGPVHRELKDRTGDENPDAITGAPGSHPVGTGVGAAAAGAAGAAVGSVVPGIGTAIGGAVGAVVGAVAGGYAGKAVAEKINPTDEHAYWRQEYRNRDYYKPNYDYDADYSPAYTSAIDAYNTNPGRGFEETEPELRESWESRRGQSRLDWEGARSAMRDVYARTRENQARDLRGDNIDRV
jgi:hypothetical protein